LSAGNKVGPDHKVGKLSDIFYGGSGHKEIILCGGYPSKKPAGKIRQKPALQKAGGQVPGKSRARLLWEQETPRSNWDG